MSTQNFVPAVVSSEQLEELRLRFVAAERARKEALLAHEASYERCRQAFDECYDAETAYHWALAGMVEVL